MKFSDASRAAGVLFLGKVMIEVINQQPGADLVEFAVAVVYRVQQLDAGQPAFETVEQCLNTMAMRKQIMAKLMRMFDVSHVQHSVMTGEKHAFTPLIAWDKVGKSCQVSAWRRRHIGCPLRS
jgi:hypothetical protein